MKKIKIIISINSIEIYFKIARFVIEWILYWYVQFDIPDIVSTLKSTVKT